MNDSFPGRKIASRATSHEASIPPFWLISERRHETTSNTPFKKFNRFKSFKTSIGLFDDLNDWNGWNDSNGSAATQLGDTTVDIVAGYPILATYGLAICFGEAGV
jgi:hypothetical protein